MRTHHLNNNNNNKINNNNFFLITVFFTNYFTIGSRFDFMGMGRFIYSFYCLQCNLKLVDASGAKTFSKQKLTKPYNKYMKVTVIFI